MRNYFDFCIYFFRFNKVQCIISVVNLILFIMLLNTNPVKSFDGNLSAQLQEADFLVLVGYLLNLFWSIVGLISDFGAYSKVKGYELADSKRFEEILPSETEINENKYTVTDVGCIGKAIHSDEVDDFLFHAERIPVVINNNISKRIHHFIKKNKETLFLFLLCQFKRANDSEKKMFYNEQKFCLSSDPADWGKGVVCHKGGYYDTFLTNIVGNKSIKETDGDGDIIAEGRRWFPYYIKEGHYYLKPLATSEMNNEIGISTIGITRDNYLIIWRQNRRTLSSVELLAPSGSGSCAWKDYQNGNGDFIKTISDAMGRELWEESSGKEICKHYKNYGQTKVLGFFRWVEKSGKPEFVGVTKLHYSYAEISPNRIEVSNPDRHSQEPIRITRSTISLKLGELMEHKELSVPLYMNLRCLKRCIDSENTEQREAILDFLGL